MLVDVTLYFLQSAICMAFFYVLYILFLKRDTFFKLNRIFLLLSLLLSLIIPLLDIPFKTNDTGLFGVFVLNSQEYLQTNMLAEVVVTAVDKNYFIGYQYFSLFYLLGILLLAFRFIKNLIQLLVWIKKSKTINIDGVRLVILKDNYPPFSFLTTVFINENDYKRKEFLSILAHEKAHVKQLHTFDLLFIELLTVLFWLNPLVWLYKKSIRDIHEYLADCKAVSVVANANDYKMHIVNQFAGGELFQLGNSFGQSSLKKRISMLGKIKTRKVALIKFLLLFPIVALLLSAFAFTVKEEKKLVTQGDYNMLFPKLFNQHNSFYTDNSIHFVNENSLYGINKLEYKQASNGRIIYNSAEVMPYFKGGVDELYKAINKYFVYPLKAIRDKIEGDAVVEFIVTKNGTIEQAKIVKSCNKTLDKLAVDAIMQLPQWSPAIDKGNKVAVVCRLPIYFSLENRAIYPRYVAKELKLTKHQQNDFQRKMIAITADSVYTKVAQMPKFVGGDKQLKQYIAKHIRYPQLALSQDYEGTVWVQFIVNKNGAISDISIQKSVNIELNRTALEMVQKMPNWIAGKHNGKAVRVRCAMPVRFSIE